MTIGAKVTQMMTTTKADDGNGSDKRHDERKPGANDEERSKRMMDQQRTEAMSENGKNSVLQRVA